jgi:hypothetical protein
MLRPPHCGGWSAAGTCFAAKTNKHMRQLVMRVYTQAGETRVLDRRIAPQQKQQRRNNKNIRH